MICSYTFYSLNTSAGFSEAALEVIALTENKEITINMAMDFKIIPTEIVV